MNALTTLSNRLIDGYRAEPKFLAVIRVLFAAHVLFFPVDYTWVAMVPEEFFQPVPGIASLLTSVPPLGFMIGLEIARFALAVLLLVGFRTFSVSIVLTVVMVFGSSLTHSFGKVDHFILYEILPLFMAFAGWGSAYSLDSKLRRGRASSGLPMLLWALTVAVALFSASLPKAATGWLDPTREATRGFLALRMADPIRIGPLGEWFFQIDSPLFWKLLDYSTVIAEGMLVIAVFFPVLFRWSLAVLVIFHIGVYFMLGIDFSAQAFVYVVFLSPVVVYVARRISSPGVPKDGSGARRLSPRESAVRGRL